MKQLVKVLPKNDYTVRGDLPNQPIIGFSVPRNGKGWVQPKEFSGVVNIEHSIFSADGGPKTGNGWKKDIAGGINAVLDHLENKIQADIFIFDTCTELFLWLAIKNDDETE